MPEVKKANAASSPLCYGKETGKFVLMFKNGYTVYLQWQGERVMNKIVI